MNKSDFLVISKSGYHSHGWKIEKVLSVHKSSELILVSVARSTRSTSPWITCKSIAGLPTVNLPVPLNGLFICTVVERHCECKESCPTTKQNDPDQGLNLDH